MQTRSIKKIEIVGLTANGNGRSCETHECCGENVAVGDVLRLRQAIVSVNGNLEKCLKVVRIVEDAEKCIVGFVPRVIISKVLKDVEGDNRFVEVTEIYNDSMNTYKRRKSHLNKGMALCAFIDDVENILSYE